MEEVMDSSQDHMLDEPTRQLQKLSYTHPTSQRHHQLPPPRPPVVTTGGANTMPYHGQQQTTHNIFGAGTYGGGPSHHTQDRRVTNTQQYPFRQSYMSDASADQQYNNTAQQRLQHTRNDTGSMARGSDVHSRE